MKKNKLLVWGACLLLMGGCANAEKPVEKNADDRAGDKDTWVIDRRTDVLHSEYCEDIADIPQEDIEYIDATVAEVVAMDDVDQDPKCVHILQVDGPSTQGSAEQPEEAKDDTDTAGTQEEPAADDAQEPADAEQSGENTETEAGA